MHDDDKRESGVDSTAQIKSWNWDLQRGAES